MDETDINLLFKIVLEDRGFKVDTFEDPIAALEKYRLHLYELLILDIKMLNLIIPKNKRNI